MGPGHIFGDGGSCARHLSAKVVVPSEPGEVWVTLLPGRGRAVAQEAVAEGSASCASPEGTQTRDLLPAATSQHFPRTGVCVMSVLRGDKATPFLT